MNPDPLDLAFLAGPGHAEARAARGSLAALALAEADRARARAGLPPFGSVGAYVEDLSRRTVCLTLLAGAGSRWVDSLRAAAASSRGAEAEEAARYADMPRGLYPVRDFLREGGTRIAIAAYAVAAFAGLGRHLLVVRGWEREIDEAVFGPLGIDLGRREFRGQEPAFGRMLGHGDAAWQARSGWSGAEYVLVNFGGDASSRLTAAASLMALDALGRSSDGDPAHGSAEDASIRGDEFASVDLVLPAASIPDPAYPIELDEGGLPRAFGHAKLQGRELGRGRGYTNVGVRAYRASALLEKVLDARERHWREGTGYAIPGNDPAKGEFALDNVDGALAAEGRARMLAIATPEELTPAKSLAEVPSFERAIERVVRADRDSLAASGLG